MSPGPVSHVPTALEVATRREGSSEGKPVYMCQATELSDATSFVSAHNPRTWINDVRSGNATARTALAGIANLALGKLRRATGATMPPARTNRSCDGTERGDSSHQKLSSTTQSPRNLSIRPIRSSMIRSTRPTTRARVPQSNSVPEWKWGPRLLSGSRVDSISCCDLTSTISPGCKFKGGYSRISPVRFSSGHNFRLRTRNDLGNRAAASRTRGVQTPALATTGAQ
jgi:hypothetical protein